MPGGIANLPHAELQPNAVKLDKLIARIESGDIKIPAFQRGFVWTQEQVIDLLDSLYRNYPVGSILLWSSTEKLKATRNVAGFEIPERPPEYPVNYVLDGQQRLSTIYGVFCKDRTQAEASPTYQVDPKTFDISFEFDKKTFVPSAEIKDPKGAIVLSVLFDTNALFAAMESLSAAHRVQAQDLFSRFSNYELPVVTISRRTKDEVGTIFERINSTGTRLSTLDLMIAWTWSEDFHLQDEINQLLDTLDAKGFGDISERIVLQSLSAILSESTTTKTILGLEPAAVRTDFPRVIASLEKAIDFLSTQFKVSSRELLPHLQQVVPLAYFFSRVPAPSAAQAQVIARWFWNTSFSRRYSSQTDEKMDEDLRLFAELASGQSPSLSRYTYTVDTRALVRQPLTKQSPFARAFLLLLAQRTPRDLTNGVAIDTGTALSSYNRKEYHHIFPRAFLKKRATDTDRINSLCNFTFLPSGSNKRISNKAPSDYMFTVVPDAERKQIFESNLMPLKLETYERDNYDEFLENRAQIVLQFLDSVTS
jgi:hypothetical protein